MCFYSIAMLFSFPLLMYVIIDLWNPYLERIVPEDYQVLAEYLLRLILVSLIFFIAAIVPRFDLFISLVGSLCSYTLAIIVAALIDIVTSGQEGSWFVLKHFNQKFLDTYL